MRIFCSLVLVFASASACGSDGASPSAGGAVSAGAAGKPAGGSAGKPAGGSAGKPAGSAGKPAGSAGEPNGGNAGEPAGGNAGAPVGGHAAGAPAGGSAGEAGAAGSGNATGSARLLDAWPREISPSRAVLFYGESLDEISHVRLGTVDVAVAYADPTKLVVVVPADTAFGPVTVAIRSNNQLAQPAFGLHVVTATQSPGSPATPIIPSPYDLTAFPPITDQWRNECKLGGNAADQYVFNVDQTVGDLLFFSGNVFYFSNNQSEVSGTLSRSTGLVRLNDLGSLYVGLFSATEHSYLLRMVLFPAARGNQLVLLGCSQVLAEKAGATCPTLVTEATGLRDAPTTCGAL